MVRQRTEEEILFLQKYMTDFFHLWRIGDRNADPYDARERMAVLNYMQFPKPGKWPGHRKKKYYMGIKPVPARIHKQRSEAGPGVFRRQANLAAATLARKLQAADFRVGKILGWGGLGMACLVEGTKDNGEKFRVVCKVALHTTDQDALATEKRNHISIAGAKHIVQRVVLQDPPQIPESKHKVPGRKTWQPTLLTLAEDFDDMVILDKEEVLQDVKKMSREELDGKDDLLFLEFMRRGNLHSYLTKVGRNVRLPDQILWQIFDCLFKGVIGMAYPSKFHAADADPEHNNVPQVTESFHGLGPLNAELPTLVHFDLDPLNILIGDFDKDEHNLVPILKIADLGLGETVDVPFRNEPSQVWGVRRSGKFHILSPEQFSEEWDYVKRTPITMLGAERGTAGNYHWWTNMYQAAQIMWVLTTLCWLEYPPVAEPYEQRLPDGTARTAWSYGTYLLDDSAAAHCSVDADLRRLIVACMNHNPTERPTMPEIEAILQTKVHSQPPATDEHRAAQLFAKQLFGDPPPPAPGSPDLASVAAAQAARQTAATPPPAVFHSGPLSPVRSPKGKGRAVGSGSSAASSAGAGLSQANLAPIRITGAGGVVPPATARPQRGLAIPAAMDDARLAEINRIARDPLARTRRVMVSRWKGWVGL